MAKLSNLRHFLRDVVNMSGAEAGSYTGLVRKAGINSAEQEAALLSHLKEKYQQGSVGGDHLDDNLDDVLKSALGVRAFGVGTGLGERVYSAGNWHSKVKLKSHKEQVLQERQLNRALRKIEREEKEAAAAAQEREKFIAERDRNLYDEKFAPETEKEFQARQQQIIDQRYDDEVAGWNKLSEDNTNRIKAAARNDANVVQQNIDRDAAIATGREQYAAYQQSKANQFLQDPMKARIARENNIDVSTPEGRSAVENAIAKSNSRNTSQTWQQQAYDSASPAQREVMDSLGLKPRRTLQEGTLTRDPFQSDMAKATGIGDVTFNGIEDGVQYVSSGFALNKAMLKGQLQSKGFAWGKDKAEGRLLKSIEDDSKKYYDQLLQQHKEGRLSQNEIQTKWDEHRKAQQERLQNGPTYGDYFFGNNMHTGLVGMAAITGTMGVAFGGHRSNADLYSSPF